MDRFRTELKSLNKSGEIRVVTQQASRELVAPLEVVLEESDGEIWLKYRFPFGGKTRPPQGALADFLSLAEERTTPEQFLRFAQQWGVLWICHQHNQVAILHPVCFPRCEEPLQSYLENRFKQNFLVSLQVKNELAELDVWLFEPLSAWRFYARMFRAAIGILLKLRGDMRGDSSNDWAILRPIEYPLVNGQMYSAMQQLESKYGLPMYQLPADVQCEVLESFLTIWMQEARLSPLFVLSASTLEGQCILDGSYQGVNLHSSPTLFAVLVAQCITAFGHGRFLKQCACTGCSAHRGMCQELIELRPGQPGRPSSYCKRCRRYTRQQQKSAWRTKKRIERSDQHE